MNDVVEAASHVCGAARLNKALPLDDGRGAA